jgi:hypothetical protein
MGHQGEQPARRQHKGDTMFRKATIVATLAALTIPAAGLAHNTPHSHVHVVKTKPSKPAHTQESVATAINLIAALPRQSQERAGYCAPVPMPRVGETDGLFMNLYADAASRNLYLTAGLVDARKDTVTGSISC